MSGFVLFYFMWYGELVLFGWMLGWIDVLVSVEGIMVCFC